MRGDARVEMDADMIRIALFNLVHNAVKYSFANRYIAIVGRERKRRQRSVYEIAIANYGVGILPHEIRLGLIFLEDYRGVLTRDRHRTGSGLGLAVAKRIIANHRGSLLVQSIARDDISRQVSRYAGTIDDPYLLLAPSGELQTGWLNIVSVLLPLRQ